MMISSVIVLVVLVGAMASCQKRDARDTGESGKSDPGLHRDTKTGVSFSGGYETDPQDHGRPVVLIAAALGVKPEVFRQAFSKVNPAQGGHPSPALARANKKVLMDALGQHGITNDRLDAVSDHYRYDRRRDKVWRNTPATAKAIVENGRVAGFKITNPGAGYSSLPVVRVAGFDDVKVEVTIQFTQDFEANGSISSLEVVDNEKQ